MEEKKSSSAIDIQNTHIPFSFTVGSSSIYSETSLSKKYIDNTDESKEKDENVVDNTSSTIQRKWDASAEKNGSSLSPIPNDIIVDQNDINEFISLVDFSCLESGYMSDAERFIRYLCKEKGYPYIIYMINELYAKNINNEMLMCALIHIISHIEYQKLKYPIVTFCVAMIANGTPLVWEYVINACDSWNSLDFVDCLERIHTDSIILKRMIKKVITRIKIRNGSI